MYVFTGIQFLIFKLELLCSEIMEVYEILILTEAGMFSKHLGLHRYSDSYVKTGRAFGV